MGIEEVIDYAGKVVRRITGTGNGSGNNGDEITVRAGDSNNGNAYIGRGLNRRAQPANLVPATNGRLVDPSKPLVNLISEHYGDLCAYYGGQGSRKIDETLSGEENIRSFDDLRSNYLSALVRDLLVRDGEFNRLSPLSVDQVIEAWEKVKTALPYSKDPETLENSPTQISKHDYYSILPTRARLGNILTLWYGLQAEGVKVRKEDLDGLVDGTEKLLKGNSEGIKAFVPYLIAFPQIRTRIRELYQGITEKIPRDDELKSHELFETRQNLCDSALHKELTEMGYTFTSDNSLLEIVKKHADSFKRYIKAHHELYTGLKANGKDNSDEAYLAAVIALRKKHLTGFVNDLYIAENGNFNNNLQFTASDLAEAWHELSNLMPYSNGEDGKPRQVISPPIDPDEQRTYKTEFSDFNVVNSVRKEIAAMLLLRAGLQDVEIEQEDLGNIILGSFYLGNKTCSQDDEVFRVFAEKGIELDKDKVIGLTPLYPLLFATDPRQMMESDEASLTPIGEQVFGRIRELYNEITRNSTTTSRTGLRGLAQELRENFSQLPVLLGYYNIQQTRSTETALR